MPWVRIDEEFPDHPKVVGAGPLGIAMQVAALCYCNRHLTDGFVPRSAARRLIDLDGLGVSADDVISTLLGVGMWSRVDGGYQIHDYEHYQPTRAQVLAERERNREAGKKGGLARAGKRSAKQSASGPVSAVPSNGQADRLAKPQAKSKPVPVPPYSLTTHPEEYSPPAVIHNGSVENPVKTSQRRAKLIDPLGVADALAPITGNTPSRPTRDQLRWREEATKRAAAARADREATQ
jgi:hypothetical protein